MSASNDQSQKVRFIFPNLRQTQSQDKKPLYSQVIKAEDLNRADTGTIKVTPYIPSEMIGKKTHQPSRLTSIKALEGLKGNLKELNELQARLRFMLKELENLVED